MKKLLNLAILILAVSSLIGCQKELETIEPQSSLKILENEFPYGGQVVNGFIFPIEIVGDEDGRYLSGLAYDVKGENGYKINPLVTSITVEVNTGQAVGSGTMRGDKLFLNFFRDTSFLKEDVTNKLYVHVQTRTPQKKEEIGRFSISLSDYNLEGYRNGVRAYEDKNMRKGIDNIYVPSKKSVTDVLQVVGTALYWNSEQGGPSTLAHMTINTYGWQGWDTHKGYINKIHYSAKDMGVGIVGKKATLYLNGHPYEITVATTGVIDVGVKYFSNDSPINILTSLETPAYYPTPTATWEFKIEKIEYTQILENRTEVPSVASGLVFNLPATWSWQR